MTPATFPEQNRELGPPPGMESAVMPLGVYHDGECGTSLWRASWRERLSILVFGNVWVDVLGKTQPPIALRGVRTVFRRP